MSALTMNGEFSAEKPVDREKTSKPAATPVAEPVKETKMTSVATPAAAGTPFSEKLAGFGRAILIAGSAKANTAVLVQRHREVSPLIDLAQSQKI